MGDNASKRPCDTLELGQAIIQFFGGYFATHQRADKTIKAYKTDLRQFQAFAGKDLNLTSLTSETIESWSSYLKAKNFSPATVRRKIVALRVFISYWMRKGTIRESPFWRVQLSYGRTEQLPRSLTEREIQTLLGTARQSIDKVIVEGSDFTCGSSVYRTIRNLAIVELLFATGMRVGEVSGLTFSDYVSDEAAFMVRGKGGVNRLAFVVDQVALSHIQKYMKLRRSINANNSALFLNHCGGKLSTQGMANLLSDLGRKGNLGRHITPHMLRHTVATLLMRNGVDIRVVQEFLGHASIATTQRYTHVSKEHLKSVLRRQHPSLTITCTSQRFLWLT